MSRRLQITLQPKVLRWARERARLEPEELAHKMHVKPERLLEWEDSGKISVAQADRLAFYTRTPVGYLYLTQPLDDGLPVSDFRTQCDIAQPQPSPELFDTVFFMMRRQTWMREELIEVGSEPLGFVGGYSVESDPLLVASAMRNTFQLERNWAMQESSWTAALSRLRDQADRNGVLVVFNSVFGNNTYRRLDRNEFQGFALVDEFAPLVFVNSTDFRAAQMFILAHELAHLFVGESGVSRFDNLQPPGHATEEFCNRTAAEFLAPEEEVRAIWPEVKNTVDPYQAIARRFKISSLVAARRALDLRLIDQTTFLNFYGGFRDVAWRNSHQDSPAGGNFWLVQKWRLGPRFAAAIVRAVSEGRLLHREAYSLTGLRGDIIEKLPEKMGLVLK